MGKLNRRKFFKNKCVKVHGNKGREPHNKGGSSWNKGLTKETDDRMMKLSISWKGKPKIHKIKPRRKSGYHRPSDVKTKISIALKGKPKLEETRIKMSVARKGPNSSLYIDGRSYKNNPYNEEWNGILKRKILNRNNNKCQLCSKERKDDEKQLHIHHIDYNRLNCSLNNLVTLCQSCHMKTNTNREKWVQYFEKRLSILDL